MNDAEMIQSLERKGCTVRSLEDKYVIQAEGVYGQGTFIIDKDNLSIFHGAYTMAFNFMMKRHQLFVTMMSGRDVG